MTGLVLKLGPNERVLINGVVVENGNRRSRINILTPNANILRLRDAIHPEDANTPVRRVCYILQLILSGDTELSNARLQAIRGVEQLGQVLTDKESVVLLSEVAIHIKNSNIYPALKTLRYLLPREAYLLARQN